MELYQLFFLPLNNIITFTYTVRNNDWLINIESWRDTNMFDDRCLKIFVEIIQKMFLIETQVCH